MKKLISVFTFLIVIIGVTKAQDKIISTSGDTINCRIVKISDTKIQYEQKNKEGQNVGRFISTDQVLEYIKTSPTQTELPQYIPYAIKPPRIRIPAERPIRLSASFGYGFLPSRFSSARNEMSRYASQDELDKYFKKLKNGINVGADFYGFTSDIFGLGLKYSFFASRTHIKEVLEYPVHPGTYNPYQIPMFISTEINEKYFLHTIEVSIIFRTWLDEKKRFAMNEILSFGYSYLRNELRGGQYSALYPNALLIGEGFTANFDVAFEYYPVKFLSISANIGAYFTSIRNMKISAVDENGFLRTDSGKTKWNDMSKLDFTAGVHFYLGKAKK